MKKSSPSAPSAKSAVPPALMERHEAKRTSHPRCRGVETLAMKTIVGALLAACLGSASLSVEPQTGEIDFQKARQLFERQQSGETLSAEERAYIDRAKAMRAQAATQPPGSPASAGAADID